MTDLEAGPNLEVFTHDLHELHFVNDTPLTDIAGTYFEHEIVWLYHEGITVGCNSVGTRFCPTLTVSREQMASFLVRAVDDLAPSSVNHFVDDDGSVHEPDINGLADGGVSNGCGTDEVAGGGPPNLLFCPGFDVSREQMASFIARALDLPAPGDDYFDDDTGSVHEEDINKLFEAGIAVGCGDNSCCPHDPVTREQMAAFLYRALGA